MSNKINVPISGMHCRSCEILVEENLSEISGVKRTVVNCKKGIAEIFYDGERPSLSEIENAICKAGYGCGENAKKSWLSKNPEDYKDLGIAFLFLVGIYIIAKNLGITSISFASASNPSGLGVVFLVGITAGLSSCMALVGGLILGISARHSELYPEASAMQKFRPHLFFNAGRIGGYALLGGILGMVGSAIQFSAGTLGLMTIIVGVVMLALGVKLIGIFPKLESGGLTLPKSVSRFLGMKNQRKEYSHRGSIISGALTFFLPCGFTQAMQLYAVSTRSFTQGALIMGVFALGTAPGLLGVGGLTSAVKGAFAQKFFKFAGLLVIFLALFNINNGINLAGWQLPIGNSSGSGVCTSQESDCNTSAQTNSAAATAAGDVQTITMTETASGYSPNTFTVKKGVPIKWVINSQDPYSCASSVVVPSLGIRKNLVAGQNEIDFTPSSSGTINFSCSMGMYTGKIVVE